MAQRSKTVLKTYFETGKKPTQEQFWDLIESYFHKDEPITLEELSMLKANLATIDKTSNGTETIGNVDTKEQVNAKINSAINALKANAPETYDTLKEIADYIANDSNAEAALLQLINTKLDKPTMTNNHYGLWDDTNKKFVNGNLRVGNYYGYKPLLYNVSSGNGDISDLQIGRYYDENGNEFPDKMFLGFGFDDRIFGDNNFTTVLKSINTAEDWEDYTSALQIGGSAEASSSMSSSFVDGGSVDGYNNVSASISTRAYSGSYNGYRTFLSRVEIKSDNYITFRNFSDIILEYDQSKRYWEFFKPIKGANIKDGLKLTPPASITTQPNMLIPKTDGSGLVWYDNASVANDLVSTQYVSNAIDDIEIGGRNLILNSSDFSKWRYNNTYVELLPNKKIKYKGNYYVNLFSPNEFTVTNEEYYTLSFYVDEIVGNTFNVEFKINDSGHGIFTKRIILGKNIFTVKLPPNIYYAVSLYDSSNNINNYLIARDFKLEKGNKATDWTPAPEDTEELINNKLNTPTLTNNYLPVWDDINKKFVNGNIKEGINNNNNHITTIHTPNPFNNTITPGAEFQIGQYSYDTYRSVNGYLFSVGNDEGNEDWEDRYGFLRADKGNYSSFIRVGASDNSNVKISNVNLGIFDYSGYGQSSFGITSSYGYKFVARNINILEYKFANNYWEFFKPIKGANIKDGLKLTPPDSITPQSNMLIPKTDGSGLVWYDNASVAKNLLTNVDLVSKLDKPTSFSSYPSNSYKFIPILDSTGDAKKLNISTLLDPKLDRPVMTNSYYGLWDDVNKKFTNGTIKETNGNVVIGTSTNIPVEKLEVNGNIKGNNFMVEENGGGIILKSPDGTKTVKISVDNAGNLVTTLL